MKLIKRTSLDSVILVLILLIGLFLRLYKLNSPLADHHSWRQADTASVIRNLATEKFDPFSPQKDNLMPTSTNNLANPNRYFFEDFPLTFDVFPAILYRIFGVKEFLARYVTIAFSLGIIIFVFLLVKEILGKGIALLSAFFLSVLPFSFFYSRSFLQEPAAIFYFTASLYFLFSWSKEKKSGYYFWLSAVLASLSILAKTYNLFFLPLIFYIFWIKEGWKMFLRKDFYFYWLIVVLPFFFWWFWIYEHPEGLPYSTWLLNEGGIRLKGAWFYWLFAERLGKLILGYWGIFLLSLGLIIKEKSGRYLFHLWFFCLIVFWVVFAKGNVTHDYYQYFCLPVVAVFLAKGSYFLLTAPKAFFNKTLCSALFALCTLLMLAFSWYYVRDFYNLQGGVDLAGKAIDTSTSSEALVIAGDGADPTLLYNTNRKGWAIGFGSLLENSPETITKLRSLGAQYYVTTQLSQLSNSGFTSYMKSNYQVLEETNQYIIFSL